jgi:hypothetical protein
VQLGSSGLPGWKAVDATHAGCPSRLLIDPNSHLQSGISFTQSGPMPSLSYARAMLRDIMADPPPRLLVLGAGICAIPTAALHLCPSIKVTAVDSEWSMRDLSLSMFGASPDIRFVHSSALGFLSSSRVKYDMVLIDAFGADGLVPPELVSLEAGRLLRRSLASGGRLSWNVSFRRSPRWSAAMSDLMATMTSSGLACEAYASWGSSRAANALLYHPSALVPPSGWSRRRFSPLFRRPVVRHSLRPFEWPAARL